MHLFKAPKLNGRVGLKSEIEQEHECLTCGWDPGCRANVLGKSGLVHYQCLIFRIPIIVIFPIFVLLTERFIF